MADIGVAIPGDKSTSTRALLLALLAEGPCRVDNVPSGRTTDRVLGVLRQLGAGVVVVGSTVQVSPPTQLSSGQVLDCGGSATLARILLGLLAGANVDATVDGSAMLRLRPMERVRQPLVEYFGRDVVTLEQGRLPARIHPGPPPSKAMVTSVESAQVRSALCFAAITAQRPFPVTPAVKARATLERLCAQLDIDPAQPRVPPFVALTPSDPSAEAFPLALALALGRGLVFTSPPYRGNDRRGFLEAVKIMGARFRADDSDVDAIHLDARSEPLRGLLVAADGVATPALTTALTTSGVYAQGLWLLMDEVPVLAALCALATTPSRLCGLGELRVKESDRISRTAEMLQAFGADVVEQDDDLLIAPALLRRPHAPIRTDHDHRIAMSALTLGCILDVEVELDDPACVDESWPGFASFIKDTAQRLRAT